MQSKINVKNQMIRIVFIQNSTLSVDSDDSIFLITALNIGDKAVISSYVKQVVGF